MRTTADGNDGAAGGGPRSAWNRFWFTPTDPTGLGFMRVVTGLIVLYVHLAYCFDLNEFFGKDSWWPVELANNERKQSPTFVQPMEWEDFQPGVRLPELQHRRKSVMAFYNALPGPKAERKAALAYLENDVPLSSPESWRMALDWARALGQVLVSEDEPAQRAQVANLLFPENGPGQGELAPPPFIREMSEEQRRQVADDVLAFIRLMPPDQDAIMHVASYFADMGAGDRDLTLKFIHGLPEEPGARTKKLRYLWDWGVDPDAPNIHNKGRYIFSLWFHLYEPTSVRIAHGVILGIFTLFTVGAFTRVTSVLTWLAAVSYLHRAQQVLFGMDQMMNILLFYLMIGNSGAAFSVDRLVARYRAARALARAGGKPVPWAEAVLAGPARSWSANLALRLFQVHFCFIYMSAGLSKLKGTTWWDHSAPWLTLANPEFSPINLELYEKALLALSHYRWVITVICSSMVAFTLFVEIGFPFLVWGRLRPVMVMGAVMLHAGISFFMGLTMFGALMMTMLLAYVPASVIRDAVCWPLGAGTRLLLRFNSRSARQVRTAAMVKAFDVADQVEWRDEAPRAPTSPAVLKPAGVGYHRKDRSVFETALTQLVLLRNVSWLRFVPGFTALGRWLFAETASSAESPTAAPEPKAPVGVK